MHSCKKLNVHVHDLQQQKRQKYKIDNKKNAANTEHIITGLQHFKIA